MKNSTLNRSMLSSENMALLAELKNKKDNENVDLKETKESSKSKHDELDILWQNFKFLSKEEKSPGIYILTGFIAGALSMFLMTAMLSITTFANSENNNDVKERKIVKKFHGSFILPKINSKQKQNEINDKQQETNDEIILNTVTPVINDKYIVKSGDSLEAISVKFYGKTSPENTKKIQKANGLTSPHSIYIGQELLIPMN